MQRNKTILVSRGNIPLFTITRENISSITDDEILLAVFEYCKGFGNTPDYVEKIPIGRDFFDILVVFPETFELPNRRLRWTMIDNMALS